ncbi:putative reverse transcriptase domain-containing protein [Tanacetum coccineum]
MDKSWMETNRINKSYVDGVAAFTDYAVHNLQKDRDIDHETIIRRREALYEGGTDFTKLSINSLQLLNLKGKYGASDKFFTELLGLIKKMLLLDDKDLTACQTCGISRWKVDDKDKRKYYSETFQKSISEDLRWHATRGITDGVLCHPADSQALRTIDEKFPEIAEDTRNLQLGISAHGVDVNTGNMHHSVWPVLTVIYNLPPWLCMKRKFINLSVLISGYLGNDIDVILEPLVDDLHTLFEIGVDTYDSSIKDTFNLHAVVLWTINDYPALGTLCGSQKNVPESIVGTLLHVLGKTKDGLNARLDLAELGVKLKLFVMQDEDKTTLPPAGYTLTNVEKDIFCETLHNIKVERELAINKESVSKIVRWISYGPRAIIVKYNAYNINGYTFRTKCHDGKVYQNSGVSVEAIDLHISKEVATIRQAYYYGVLQEIWVLDYRFRQIPLFKCDWVNHKSGGVKRDKLGYTLVDLNNLGHKVDPFVLGSQALQVFYVKNPVDKKLSIVFKTPPKNYKDTYDEVDEEFSTVIHHRNDNVLPLVDQRDLANESRDDYYRKDCGENIVVNLDSSSDNNNSDSYSTSQISTSEEIDYDSPEPPKSLLKWYHYLSDEYKDNGRFWGSKSGCNESDVKPSWKDIEKAKACMLAKAQASEASSKAKVEACGSKAKLQASTKTLIVKSPGRGSLEVDKIIDISSDSSDDRRWAAKKASAPVFYGPSTQGLLDAYGYNTIEEYLSWNYFPSTDMKHKLGKLKTGNTDKICCVNDLFSAMSKGKYVPICKKHNPNMYSPVLVTGCVLGLASVTRWDEIERINVEQEHQKIIMQIRQRGKERCHMEVDHTKEEHEMHLGLILKLFKKEKLYVKLSKCEFWLEEVQFLGHVINGDGIHIDPSKIKDVKNWEAPRTPLEKSKMYDWGEEQERAFPTLKDKLCNAPILALPDGLEDFVVYCDASCQGLGKKKISLDYNNSFLGEYKCSSLALDREERRDEKKRLDHLKQDQTMLVIKRFRETKKVFRERKKSEKIHAKRKYDFGVELGLRAVEEEVVPKVDDVSLVDGVFDGEFGGDGEKDVVMGEGVVVSSSSLEMLTKSCLDEMMVSLIFLEGLEEEA